jgi:ubiquinone/menaquinone biosynthesis C-methylase UbiE
MMKQKNFRRWLWVLALSLPLLQCSLVDDWRKDEEEVNAIQPPAKVMDAVGVKEGMVIGEFGAGRGRYTLHLAARVGEMGTVYANDIEESYLAQLRRRCQDAGLKNVKTVLGRFDDPLFPAGSLDMAFSTRAYHEIEDRVAFMRNLRPALKPGASVVIIDFEKNEERRDPGPGLKKEAEEAGYEIVSLEKLNEYDILAVLRAKTP